MTISFRLLTKDLLMGRDLGALVCPFIFASLVFVVLTGLVRTSRLQPATVQERTTSSPKTPTLTGSPLPKEGTSNFPASAHSLTPPSRSPDGKWITFTGDQLGTLFASAVLEKYKASGKPLGTNPIPYLSS